MYIFTSGNSQHGIYCKTAGQQQSTWQRGAVPAVFPGRTFASNACWRSELCVKSLPAAEATYVNGLQ